jgi:nucleotide-binding universal stress UspA family protein
MFERILVPLDGSRFSVRALRYGIEVAKHFSAEVILMRVVPPASLTVATGPPEAVGSPVATRITAQSAEIQNRSNLSRANRYLRRKLRELAAEDINGSCCVALGSPAESIMRRCRRGDVDLVVMATHGRSGLKRAFVGSVADEVIRSSGVPVLVIRPGGKRRKK